MALANKGRWRRLGLAAAVISVTIATGSTGAASSAFPGALGRIVFVRGDNEPTLHYALYTMRRDGSDVRELTKSDEQNLDPAYSPDGSRVVFVRGPDTNGPSPLGIFVMSSDGTHVRALTNPPGRAQDILPAWSPDGTQVAFVSNRGGGYLHLYVIDADGRKLRLLARAGENLRPAWSPDGSQIIVPANNADHHGLVLVDPRTGAVRRAIVRRYASGPLIAAPAWSPDGREIAFVYSRDCGPNCDSFELYLTTPRGRGTRLITTNAWTPAWSPDGRTLLYTHDPRGDARVYARRVQSGRDVDLTPVGGGFQPNWQPQCQVLGTDRTDRLDTTRVRQLICALEGDDLIVGRRGQARVFAGSGSDRILVRNRRFDLVSCGSGADSVEADRFDHVARDCERVHVR